MLNADEFADFLCRVRAGDADAASALVREYEPLIRREVRLRLTDPRLCRLYDSADICQSVLRSFFVRAAAGQYELGGPRDLRQLLVAMAYNKVATKARRLRRPGPDRDQAPGDAADELGVVADRRPSAARLEGAVADAVVRSLGRRSGGPGAARRLSGRSRRPAPRRSRPRLLSARC